MKVQKPQTIESVNDFLKNLPPEQTNFKLIYRGHEKASYKLIPSLFRQPNYPRDEKTYFEILDEALENICPDQDLTEIDEWTKSAIAQHHGIPTPILDWTFCPKIALFFASQYVDSQEDAEVIALYGKPKTMSKEEGYDIDEAFPYLNTLQVCDRQVKQKGLFTYNPFFDQKKPVPIDEIESYNEPKFTVFRYRIPQNLKTRILSELDEQGINFKMIYHDKEGASKHALWKIRQHKSI